MLESDPQAPSDVFQYLLANNNWGRWKHAEHRGAVNLITEAKVVQASRLVLTGETISLSRDVPTLAAPGNPRPAQHYVVHALESREDCCSQGPTPADGVLTDFLGFEYHSHSMTHIDALCHIWSRNGMWGGRDPSREVGTHGSQWADISAWRDGIVTRGVLLDIPLLRGTAAVTLDQPVREWELRDAAKRQNVRVEPGDALVVYCGREAWEEQGNHYMLTPKGRPGLDGSCVRFIRENDVSLLFWDMLDAMGSGTQSFRPVHGVLWAFGVGLVDNCKLGELAGACRRLQRYEFLISVAPLPVIGGSGSPVNPIVMM